MIFLSAGILIHSFNTQSIKMFGRIRKFTLVKRIFLLARFSIRGVIFYSGFFSKDLILDVFFSYYINYFIYFLFVTRIVLTIFYSLRIVTIAFISLINKPLIEFNFFNILTPLITLGGFSLYAGNIIIWKFIFFTNLFSGKKIFIFLLILLSISNFLIFLEGQLTSYFFSTIWFLNNFISIRVSPLKKRTHFLDKSWIELIGRKGVYTTISSLSFLFSFWESKSFKILLYFLFIWGFFSIIFLF